MKLTKEQIEKYHNDGFLFLENVFTKEEMDLILQEMDRVIQEDSPRRILEKTGAVRSFFAPDFTSGLFHRLTRMKRLVEPSKQLLDAEVYIHQTKINSKHAMVGDWWEWHQDYTFWKKDDGMPAPEVLTAMIYLNNTNEFNGPMLLIPGSHKAGTVDEEENITQATAADSEWFRDYQNSTTYMSALTANLKFTVKQNSIARWVARKGIQSAKGPAGSVLFFHGDVFHASSNNLSPWDRHAFLVTYNSVNNALRPIENPRPTFIANRDFTPVTSIGDDLLLQDAPVNQLL